VLYSIPGLPPDLSRPIEGCSFNARCPYPKLKPAAGPQPPLVDRGEGHCVADCRLCDSSLPIEDVLAGAQTA